MGMQASERTWQTCLTDQQRHRQQGCKDGSAPEDLQESLAVGHDLVWAHKRIAVDGHDVALDAEVAAHLQVEADLCRRKT